MSINPDTGTTKDVDWDLIPKHCQPALSAYITWGQPMPSFLTAVVSNDLITAAKMAGVDDQSHLFSYAKFLFLHVHTEAYGSPEFVRQWIAGGGMQGRQQRHEL